MSSTFQKILISAAAGLALIAGGTMLVAAQQGQQIRTPRQTPFPVNPDFSKLQVQTLKIQGNVYLLAGAGGNIAVQIGDDGVLLVDTGYEQMSGKILEAIRKISNKPIRTIINTTLACANAAGNGALTNAGIINQAGPGLGGRPNEAMLIGHNKLLRLMTEIGEAKIPTDRWPPNTYPGKSKDMYSNDEPVIMMNVPGANTSGDTMVWFRKYDVVATGEIFNEKGFTYIYVEHDVSINVIIAGLNLWIVITET